VRRFKKTSAAARTVPLFAEPEHQPPKATEEKAARPKKATPSYEWSLVRGGLVERTAIAHYVRFGTFPDFFLVMVNGVVPTRILERAKELRRAERGGVT
jgi:hypothetical protein